MEKLKPLLNFIIFHGSWWAVILLAIFKPVGYIPILVIVSLLNCFVHFRFIEKNKKAEALFLLASSSAGILIEIILLNIYVYRYGFLPNFDFKIPPIWIFCIWTIFPLSIGHSLSFLYKLRLPGMLLGAALTTLTYSAGERLDLLYFTEPKVESMAYFCGVWFALLAFLYKLRENIHKKIPIN